MLCLLLLAAGARTVRTSAGAHDLAAAAAQGLRASALRGTEFRPGPTSFQRGGDSYYAYVLRYFMAKEWGVEIVHTALAFCPANAHRQERFAAYAAECNGKIWGSCWKPEKMVERVRGDRAERTGLLGVDCIEVGFLAESEGERDREPQPAGVLGLRGSDFEYAGDSDPSIFSMGRVSGAAIDRALSQTTDCPRDTLGKRMDFNPFTYDFIGHNCHHHTEAMLGRLALPAWSRHKELPADMMPEDGSKNPIKAAIIEKFVQKPRKIVSAKCEEYERTHPEPPARGCLGC